MASTGELLTAVGIGAVIGAAAVILFARWLDLKFLLVVTGAGSGATLVLLGLSHQVVLSLLGAALVGATQSAFMALYLALLQGTAAPEMRGRVAAFSNILVGSTMSTGALAWGVLVGPVSAGWVLAAPGLLFVVVLAIALALSRWLRPPTIGKPRVASGPSSGATVAPVG